MFLPGLLNQKLHSLKTGIYWDRSLSDKSPYFAIKLSFDLIGFLQHSGTFRLLIQRDALFGDVSYLCLLIEDDVAAPYLVQCPLEEGDKAVLSDLFDQQDMPFYFVDLLNRPMLTALCRAENKVSFQHSLGAAETMPVLDRRFERLSAVMEAFSDIEGELPFVDVQIVTAQPDAPISLISLKEFAIPMTSENQLGLVGRKLKEKNLGLNLENDAAELLFESGLFQQYQILVNPHRVDDGRELCDILVVSEEDVLVFQVKKSKHKPVLEASRHDVHVGRVQKLAEQAFSQLGGAYSGLASGKISLKYPDDVFNAVRMIELRALEHEGKLPYSVADHEIILNVQGRRIWLIALLPEIYPESFEKITPVAFGVSEKTGVPAIPLGLVPFSDLLHSCDTAEALVSTICSYWDSSHERGSFFNVRFARGPNLDE